MNAPPRIVDLAVRQWRDYTAHRPGTMFEGDAHVAMDVEEAYRIQRLCGEIRCAMGDRQIGYKIGNTASRIQEQLGFREPVHGLLFSTELHQSGVRLDPGYYANLAVEAEIAVQLDERRRPSHFVPVIELHNYVFRASRPTAAELIANNCINAGIVIATQPLPQACDDWEKVGDLAIRIGDRVLERASAFSVPGGPATALAWLERALEKRRACLAPHDIVLTGTPLGLYPVRPGDTVQTIVAGTVQVTCHIGQQAEAVRPLQPP